VNYNTFLNRDYLSLPATRRSRQRHWLRLLLIGGSVSVATAAYLIAPLMIDSGETAAPATSIQTTNYTDQAVPKVTASRQPDEAIVAPATEQDVPLLEVPFDEEMHDTGPVGIQPTSGSEAIAWQRVTIKRGDNLSRIFSRVGLSQQQLHQLLEADSRNRELTHLMPGKALELQIRDGELLGLRYLQSATETLRIERRDDRFYSYFDSRPLEQRVSQVSAVIEDSLYLSGQRAGLSDKVIMELASIFGWDIDFALDIRAGDAFTVFYEQHYLDGEKQHDGAILAAQFSNQGRTYQAFRFTDDAGNSRYYDANGMSMRKAFLRSPVDFHRISSRFQKERYHPVLGTRRPHRGVDYAAATGTPVKASGDGKITFHGWKGGYGRAIIIQHGQRYSTLYGHLSNFRNGLTTGSRVRQGQIIGYVGKSGLATGPHLHYEFRVDGEHRDPLTVQLPNAEPITAHYRQAFTAAAEQWLAKLAEVEATRVVLNAD